MNIKALYTVTTNVNATASLQIFGEIGAKGFSLKDFKAATGDLEISQLEIDLNSPGGDPFEAFAIHDAIRTLSARVTVNIIGMAASAATIIAAAADRITITENSRYLIHEASTLATGKRADMEATGELLGKIDAQMVSVYVKRTGKTEAELSALMQKDSFISAHEALEWGFVDEIIEVKTNKIAAMANEKPQVTGMSDEEKEKYEAIEKENEDLKSQLEALKTELEGLKAESEKKDEEDVEAQIDAGIETGKIKADAKESFFDIGKKIGPKALKSMLENIEQPQPQSLASVPQVGSREGALDVKKMSFDEKYEAFKAGKITLKQMEG